MHNACHANIIIKPAFLIADYPDVEFHVKFLVSWKFTPRRCTKTSSQWMQSKILWHNNTFVMGQQY